MNLETKITIYKFTHQKNISKKRAKCLHNSIYPLIFAPRLRDNASEKKEVWVSG